MSDEATGVRVSAWTTEDRQALLNRIGRIEYWLHTLLETDISDDARRDGLALLAGEPEPGRT